MIPPAASLPVTGGGSCFLYKKMAENQGSSPHLAPSAPARESESAKRLGKIAKTGPPTGEIECAPCNARRSIFSRAGLQKCTKTSRKSILLSSACKKTR